MNPPATRAEREAVARRLRDEGWLLREIAEHMGVAVQTVHAWISDPGGKRLRERKDSYRGTCDLCGGPTNGGDGNAPTRCQDCTTWTPEALLLWVRDWADGHGGVPPRAIDFSGGYTAAPSRCFGSWNGLLLAAGFGLHRDGRPETTEAIFAALRAGERTADIAARHGVTPEAIKERCRVRGLTIREIRRGATK